MNCPNAVSRAITVCLLGSLSALPAVCQANAAMPKVERLPNGVQLTGSDLNVRVQFYSQATVRVVKWTAVGKSDKASLSVIQKDEPDLNVRFEESDAVVTLTSGQVKVQLSKSDGTIQYLASDGHTVLREQGPAVFAPCPIEKEKAAFGVQQSFTLTPDGKKALKLTAGGDVIHAGSGDTIDRHRIGRNRHIEIGREKQQCPVELRRGHAEDGVRMLVQADDAADDGAIVLKLAMPIRVGEHDIRSAVGATLIGRLNEPAQIRLNAQCVEVIPAHSIEIDAGWILASVEAALQDGVSGQGIEAAIAIAQIEIVGIRLIDVIVVAALDCIETSSLRNVERAQEQPVQDGKDDGVCADGQRQRQDGDDGESGSL